MKISKTELLRRAKKIKLFAMDVDGVITDGSIIILDSGEEVKFWNVRDRIGFFMLRRAPAAFRTAWITGRASGQVRARANEIGVDALNPMQVSAAGMSPENLRRRFAGRMAFWGGIDSQYVLPKGAPDDVRRAVQETLAVMGPNGGYVLGAVHNIQDDVPPENVWEMLDEAARAKTSA